MPSRSKLHFKFLTKYNQLTPLPFKGLKQNILENVAVNDVLPLYKVARRDASASANLKCFWAPGHEQPNFSGCIYIHYAAPPYSARISSIYLLPFGKVWLGPVY